MGLVRNKISEAIFQGNYLATAQGALPGESFFLLRAAF